MKGVVKFFNTEKAFGFIKSSEDDKEYFVHISGINGGSMLEEGQNVSFDVEEGDRGPKAVNVTLEGAGAVGTVDTENLPDAANDEDFDADEEKKAA